MGVRKAGERDVRKRSIETKDEEQPGGVIKEMRAEENSGTVKRMKGNRDRNRGGGKCCRWRQALSFR